MTNVARDRIYSKATKHKLIHWFAPCRQLYPGSNLLGNRARIFLRDVHWLAHHSRHNHWFWPNHTFGHPSGSSVLCYILYAVDLYSSASLRQDETSL